MKNLLFFLSLFLVTNAFADVRGLEQGLEDEIRLVNVITEKENFKGKPSLKVYADPEVTDSIREKTAKLIKGFQSRGKQPTLIINNLKTGREAGGSVALWIHSSTIGRFSNLKITR